VKGEEKLWQILQEKLEMLRAGNRLPEALRVGDTALEMAQRIFPADHPSLALSYERLGRIHDQQGNHGEAKVLLEKALRIKGKIKAAMFYPTAVLVVAIWAMGMSLVTKHEQRMPVLATACRILVLLCCRFCIFCWLEKRSS